MAAKIPMLADGHSVSDTIAVAIANTDPATAVTVAAHKNTSDLPPSA